MYGGHSQSLKEMSKAVYAAKGVGILLVVIGHCHIPGGEPAYWVESRKVIYQFHMPLFMFLSGFLYGAAPLPGNLNDYITLVRKKAARLLLPYFSITVLYLFAKGAGGLFVDLQHPVHESALVAVLTNPLDGLAPLLWFVYVLFEVFLIFPIMATVIRYRLMLVAVLFGLSMIPWPRVFLLKTLFRMLPYFAMGYYCMEARIFGRLHSLALGLMFAAVFLIGYQTGVPWMALGGFSLGPYVMGLAGILACVFLCKALNSSFPLAVSIGAYSASIYLLHGLAMGPVRVLLFEVISTPAAIFPLMAVIVCSAGLVFPIVVGKFLLRPCPLLNALILGQPAKE